jgi:GNAT superfamily N-acetyltransferase
MEEIKIVTLKSGDWNVYRDLRLRALQEEPQAYGSTYADNVSRPASFWKERLQDALEEKIQWLVFAKLEDKLVGMAGAFSEEKNTVHVIAVYVIPEQRGKGISKLLMKDLLMRIKRNPEVKRIIVDVNPEQLPAFNLYKNSGFQIIKKYKLVLGDKKEHDVVQLEMQI